MAYDAAWLRGQAEALIRFHAASVNPKGGFYTLAEDGSPLIDAPRGHGPARPLHETTRMVHSYAIAALLGDAGAREIVDHGMRFLMEAHYDAEHGGFFWSLDDAGPLDTRKQAYGQAFVLLAAASAGAIGHPDAARLRDLALDALTRFEDPGQPALADCFEADWGGGQDYRGANANMHLTEALLAAYEECRDPALLARAEAIADLLINRHARAHDWAVPEHFTRDWRVDRDFDGDAMFRPSGTTPGHAMEWARLLIQLHHHAGTDWAPEAAEALFARAMASWLPEGGFPYTLDWDGSVSRRWRLWWPCAEAIDAAAVMAGTGGAVAQAARDWQPRLWRFVDRVFIDHRHGGWFPQIDQNDRPLVTIFPGKPDIYHALQACLIPLKGSPRGIVATLKG